MREYKPPSNGKESHMSGMEIIEKKAYEQREKTRLARLKTMKSCIDNKAPPKFDHILRNRKKQMQDVDRFSEIERENYRLLARMSSIMTHQHMEDYVAPLCPALDKMRQRDRNNRQVAGENAILQQRIHKVKSHYNSSEWRSSMKGHDHALMYLCKYPRVLRPLSDTGIWHNEDEIKQKTEKKTTKLTDDDSSMVLDGERSVSALAGTTRSLPVGAGGGGGGKRGRKAGGGDSEGEEVFDGEHDKRRSMSAMDYVSNSYTLMGADDEKDKKEAAKGEEGAGEEEGGAGGGVFRPPTSSGMSRSTSSRRSGRGSAEGTGQRPRSVEPGEFERRPGMSLGEDFDDPTTHPTHLADLPQKKKSQSTSLSPKKSSSSPAKKKKDIAAEHSASPLSKSVVPKGGNAKTAAAKSSSKPALPAAAAAAAASAGRKGSLVSSANNNNIASGGGSGSKANQNNGGTASDPSTPSTPGKTMWGNNNQSKQPVVRESLRDLRRRKSIAHDMSPLPLRDREEQDNSSNAATPKKKEETVEEDQDASKLLADDNDDGGKKEESESKNSNKNSDNEAKAAGAEATQDQEAVVVARARSPTNEEREQFDDASKEKQKEDDVNTAEEKEQEAVSEEIKEE